ncbi:MAG TPA: ImmA/IrrE family metallo-endopeptidase [Chloroflexi bacterium]|nr:ImmA/IrrE family metallo-endopeptidase [Chloroflexota bacterium]
MNPAEETRYIAAYARIIGVQEAVVTEYAQRKGIAALVDNAYQLLETPEQLAKHQAFLDLYRMSSSLTREKPILSSPSIAAGYMHSVIDQVHDKESLVVAFLNTKNRVIDYEQVSIGTINSSVIHPREVFRNAILNKAVSVLLCHNHPSGNLTPSPEDLAVTKSLKEAGEMLGIPVVDHIIITGLNRQDVYSFRAQGVLEAHGHYQTESTLAEKKPAYDSKDKALDEITARLEEGIKEIFSSGKYADYLKVMSRFHRYSLNNTLLIAMQNPEASLVAGYHAWQKKFERHVCKGEQAIRIIAPAPERRLVQKEKLDPVSQQPILDKDGQPIMEETEINVPRFKVVPVFDVSQTEGKELPSLSKALDKPVQAYELLFNALKNASPVPIAFENMKATKDGYYHLKDKRIALRKGMSESQTLASAVHEIAHAKLHDRDPQARGAQAGEKGKDPRTQEVEAESIAYAVCQYYGIETGENSFGYVAGWSGDKELSELKASLKTIRDTASDLIDSIDAKMLELKNELDKEPAQTKETARKTVKGKAVALAEELQAYGFETAPITQTGIEGQGLRPWLRALVQEDASPYTSFASVLLKDLNEIDQNRATYMLENGERLSLLREGEGIQYQLQDPAQNLLAEGLLAEPELLLDAAKDQVLSQSGRSEIQTERISERELEALSILGASEPQVTFTRSELDDIPSGMSLPLSQANRLMERLDQRQAIDRQRSDYAGPLTYSTDFRIEYIKEGIPAAYTGKQEIGAGEGSLSHHMQLTVQEALSDRIWRNYLNEMGETQLQADPNALEDVRNRLLPYFNQHQALTFLKERTEGYQAGLASVAEEKREALTAYYADVSSYVQENRLQMNLSANPQSPDFPQLDAYINEHASEKDLDHDGSPERVDIDGQDSRVQVTHHLDKRDGLTEKQSIRERLRGTKASKQENPDKEENFQELEIS